MNILTDENIPLYLVSGLIDHGYHVVSVGNKIPGATDIEVIDFANKNNQLILTFDLDFGGLIIQDNRTVDQGVLLLRIDSIELDSVVLDIHSILSNHNIDLASRITVFDGTTIRQRRF